jgi:CRP/FNR family cyclic AMP-dependent transcriptional regulator
LKVFLNDDAGREVVLAIEESGSAFGEISLLDEEPRSASVAAIEPCELVVIGKEALLDLLKQNSELSLAMIRSLAALVRRLSGNIRTLALKNIYSRLIHLLESRAQQDGDHRVIRERLTHQLMADMIGASREMVSRIMSDLIKGGYIETSRELICIKRRLPSGW